MAAGDTRRVGRDALRTLAVLACALQLCSASEAGERPGVAIAKRAPRPQLEIKQVPDDGLHGLLHSNADGTQSLTLEFGSITLEYRASRPAEGGNADPGEMLIALREAGSEQQWRMPMAAFRQFDAALAAKIIAAGASRQLPPDGTDGRPAEELGRRLRDLLGPGEWQTLERIGHDLDTAAVVHGVTGAQVTQGVARLGLSPAAVQQAIYESMAYAAKAGECAGAIGGLFLASGGAVACWGGNGMSGGLLTAACLFATGAVVAAVLDVEANCGAHGGRSLACDCVGLPDCMCCDVDPGDACACRCPGEACCEWEDDKAQNPGRVDSTRAVR